ncbi:MAG: peptidase T [Candidatus Odinarchaeota archaeon]
MTSEVVERFLRYAKIHTTSKEGVDKIPSTERQFDLANILISELKNLGLDDASVDGHCIVTATLKSSLSEEETLQVPRLCFLAHMDTSPEEPGENVKPDVVKDYQGGDIVLPDGKTVIKTEDTPELSRFIGSDIITSDGTTLLGADNKAGIAAIMTAVSKLVTEKTKHGTVKIVFTPDEEVGNGVTALDVEALGCDYGFTVDGDEMGVLEIETFNAVDGSITIKGFNTHPGYAKKNKMVNAIRIAKEVIDLFPFDQSPETTEKYGGYYHPYQLTGSVNEVELKFILRDFDHDELKNKMAKIDRGIQEIQQRHPKADLMVDMKERYRNMKEIIDRVPHIVGYAEEAIKRAGIPVIRKPVRGGTDGARLSFRGLPSPNIFAGGMSFHSKKEFVPVIALEKSVETIVNLVSIFVEKSL